jgi:hypothetical protein
VYGLKHEVDVFMKVTTLLAHGCPVRGCSNSVIGDELWFYCAGADRLIGLAAAPLQAVIDFARASE